uniref:Uncharacterized protein n=1 Tax=Ixodes scapularis TaxID=6945 RepID=A0A4D5RC78_IXOSC
MQGSGKASSFCFSCALGFSCVQNSQLACMPTLLFTVLLKFSVVAVPDWLRGCTEILKALDVCGSSVLFFPVPRHEGAGLPPFHQLRDTTSTGLQLQLAHGYRSASCTASSSKGHVKGTGDHDISELAFTLSKAAAEHYGRDPGSLHHGCRPVPCTALRVA